MIRSATTGLASGLLTVGMVAFSTLAFSETAFADPAYDALIAKHAAANGVPESLIRRVIIRESRFRPGLVSHGNYGLMQIKPATARSMGYTGSPSGLLDADTNMTYAVKYLAGAYKVAGGSHDRAVSHYARGYYYAAKRQRGPVERTATAEPSILNPLAALTATPATPATRSTPTTSATGTEPIVLRPDSLAAFAATDTPRKSRRQRKQDKTPSLIDLFTPKPTPR
ncbi:MAG: lytic transglycosylase, catalytic [Xanthobacteraceae bacterium]|nr:lytic transglycosylase, catalytic [Xanthobacteraceae bacterium]